MADRVHDIVLLGATGFTGRLTAEQLARWFVDGSGTWAIAGRNRARLDAVRDSLAAVGAEPAVEVVDVTNPAGIRAVAERARVLVTTVGPYVDHGHAVAAACVDAGTDYCDITGEPPFVDRLLATLDRPARDQGVRLVSCCGFDSIPADLGARFTVAQLPNDAPLTVRGYMRARGMPSGGTWQSALGIIADANVRDAVRTPVHEVGGRRAVREPLRIRREPRLGAWGVPLPIIDPSIVLRSALALDAYGPDFTYGHYARVKRLPTVAGMAVGAGALAGLAKVGPTRRLLERARPSGEGPSAQQRARSWFEVTFVGEGGGQSTVTRVAGGDPGYGETAVMLSQAALSLAFDDLPEVAGVITTAQAFEGGALQRRLEDHGIRFEVIDPA